LGDFAGELVPAGSAFKKIKRENGKKDLWGVLRRTGRFLLFFRAGLFKLKQKILSHGVKKELLKC